MANDQLTEKQHKPPVVWSIGASDSGGGTGIQADLLTFNDFGVYGCTVITALNAQNSFATGHSLAIEHKSVVAQINALDSDLPATAIKLGMLPNRQTLETVLKYFEDYAGVLVYDLELDNSGESLLEEAEELIKSGLLPRVTLLVANTSEAQTLTGKAIDSVDAMVVAADQLLSYGVAAVLLTGAKFDGIEGKRFDYLCSDKDRLWITIEELPTANNKGGGSVLSAALTAALARGEDLTEAVHLGKAYVTQGIRGSRQVGGGPGAVAHLGWPGEIADRPTLSASVPVAE